MSASHEDRMKRVNSFDLVLFYVNAMCLAVVRS